VATREIRGRRSSIELLLLLGGELHHGPFLIFQGNIAMFAPVGASDCTVYVLNDLGLPVNLEMR